MGLIIMNFPVRSFLKKWKVSNKVFQQDWQVFGHGSRKCNKSTAGLSGFTETLIELCQSRHFITGDIITEDALINGWYNYGHLGMELKKNLTSKWWDSVVLSREQVFGVMTPHTLMGSQCSDNRSVRLMETAALQVLLNNKDLTKEEIVALLKDSLEESIILRSNLLQVVSDITDLIVKPQNRYVTGTSREDAFVAAKFNEYIAELYKNRCALKAVLKLHPSLAPVKVGLEMGKGPTVELRQVCEGLFRGMLEKRITVWPGYLETMHTSLEHLIMKYDEMGVIFTIVINDTTLESGLVQLRNRDTAIKELAHISEVRDFLTKYIQES
ncbi:hypothetical protein scyTo_0001571 [Scyliorhinus torazame]|uniref:Anticodon-binding domain-containing protein n=1 Tax=Scyliorhinus torazame TaxID=75743 RepID=A0A401PE77_SCYTO|nr:hypothetical protein [Scyliorhinus torazame]